MTTSTRTGLDRASLAERYRQNRRRSAQIFTSLIAPEAYEVRPIPLRHPFVFYDGHIPAFTYNKLIKEALGKPSLDAAYEVLFERGIDPASIDEAQKHTKSAWPERALVEAYGRDVEAAVLDAFANATLEDPANPYLVRAQAVYNVIEHEQMHHETLLYIVNQLDEALKRKPVGIVHHDTGAPTRNEPIEIPAGFATLGASRTAIPFGWDNEFDEHTVSVGRFAIDPHNISNGDYLRFVADGGPLPAFWSERNGTWMLRTMFETIALPLSWPVYVTNDQAAAYARWSNARVMTEAEYHRAAFGSPSGEERPHPWGTARPSVEHGNFGFKRYDPEPIGSSPAGRSAWGVHDLVGNGWEWTATPFAPFDGFEPMATYPPYSREFFDGEHFVMKGASPVTHADLVRRSLRNWFYRDYPFMFATFRRVYDR